MNAPLSGQRRSAREDCEPGDWIDATLVPEWVGSGESRLFLPEGVSISPESGRLGGVLPDAKGEPWKFELRRDGAHAYWVRTA
jgi:hypothetical protein